MTILIQGGTVVNADRSFRADVLCQDGIITAVGEGAGCPKRRDDCRRRRPVRDARGIDPHTHMQLPFMGTVASEDFYSARLPASLAAPQ